MKIGCWVIAIGPNGWEDTIRIIVRRQALEPFFSAALDTYEACTSTMPLSCFAVLVGEITDVEALIHRVEFGRNVRATASTAREEFGSVIVPCFGSAYRNEYRGFWCDSSDLLRIHRVATAQGLEIVGSIHMHPDWHRIGPPTERGLALSEAPTPMDAYMFGSAGWPVNMIYYLERPGRTVRSALGAWGPPVESDDGGCVPIPVVLLADDGV